MRPVQKFAPGNALPQSGALISSVYRPHGSAYAHLEENLGDYCSYCEVFHSDLEVEHIVSQHQNDSQKHNWDNLLLACGRCNGKDNKSNKPVDLTQIYFPQQNNTLLAFEYREGGFVMVSTKLADINQKQKAQNMLDLVGLDKYAGNPKYPDLNPRDIRWKNRRIAWELAVRYLSDYEYNQRTADDIATFAAQRGFFSVWFTVFVSYHEVKKALIMAFPGTAFRCFDANLNPMPRNPGNLDSI